MKNISYLILNYDNVPSPLIFVDVKITYNVVYMSLLELLKLNYRGSGQKFSNVSHYFVVYYFKFIERIEIRVFSSN